MLRIFILLATSSLLFLFWTVPEDTLENASGGIIGYELGQSLEQILTVYGAAIFLIAFWIMLFTLAFGIQVEQNLGNAEQRLHISKYLFYRNVPEGDTAFDRTVLTVKKMW